MVSCLGLVLLDILANTSHVDVPPSPLELWSSSAKGHIRRGLDPVSHLFRSIDTPLQDFVTALFSISKDDISSIESRAWDMTDDLVSNYRRMLQQKAHESKLYPFFQRILVRLAQELRKDEDLAFVARAEHAGGLRNQYTLRKPDGSIWWNTGDHVWHLMKATIEIKRQHEYYHQEFGYLPQTMPDILYDSGLPARGPKAEPPAPRIPTILEMSQLPGNPSTQPSNATTDLLPVPSAASPDKASATISESRVIPPVPPGSSSKKRPRESEAPKRNKRRKTSRLTIDHTQMANHALESMTSTVHRRWSIGVMVDNFWVTLWYFDRMGAIVTQPFDFAEEPWKLALVTLALGRCTPAQAGFEPLILQPSGDATTDLPPFNCPISTVVGAEIMLPRDLTKTSKEDPRFVITAPPLYVYRGVVGRGSTVYPVTALSGRLKNHELVAKWSWPLASLIYMRQHLPEVIEHREYSMNELDLPRCKIGSGEESLRHEARKLTIDILPRYKHLWALATVEKFKSVFIDLVECHYHAYRWGDVLHRDLSEGNVMWMYGQGKVPLGLLNDWDLSSIFEDGAAPPPVTQCRIGTPPFMALDLLQVAYELPIHRYYHDLESFLYILIWAMVHYNMGNEELNILPDPKQPRRLVPVHRILRGWEGNDYQANADSKVLFRISRQSRRVLFAAVQPAFKPLIRAWLEPLLNLFAQAQFHTLNHGRDSDFDKDTMGGILTFENFMKTIGAVPRDIAAESRSEL
ncbi:hypothetical protein PLEOSDRAFT_163343 [Pleurotus ostreatus PC15]|uniref:Fungal-type protein kinase domain-containing protein n=1 Tax=Pleurotus ostreatus (strain PC15) TaxID=1137138 RepID=A0A067N661_PLEO1|nr:hypothetical protein PLEOSDRAFT_163343 [Pleurotus ostreatus PC15]